MGHPSKCEHGVYWPAKDEKAFGCQMCNPDGIGDAPKVPAADRLVQRRVPLEHCDCGNLLTHSTPNCLVCGKKIPEQEFRGLTLPSNNKQPGVCPECFSGVHYQTERKDTWCCADCGARYRAPKNVEEYEEPEIGSLKEDLEEEI